MQHILHCNNISYTLYTWKYLSEQFAKTDKLPNEGSRIKWQTQIKLG